jgi:hypothetical protein
MPKYPARDCETCGLPLPPQRSGRPRVVHPGSCARTRKGEIDEATRQDRYERTMIDRATLAPGLMVSPGDVDTDGDHESTTTRLADGGFSGVFDDNTEGLPRVVGLPLLGDHGDLKERPRFGPVPKEERGFTQHRRAVLASLRPTFAEERRRLSAQRSHAVTRCYGCPVFDHVAVVAVVTGESLVRGREEWRQDDRVRRHLAEDDLAALMSARPR